ncbi:PAS domain S-box protein [Microcoleus sp. bin38.metabat.b11b12b14.051]|uniref:PAS domain S-box protein n=1 Tax=Microcoleus sp. bin38.metabat.b11b12b14.051 TaxID=2742709 RepID=UPI0025ED5446|nr:PAS domain S-box protein [Microcoleus sp. bin38.metabat.b11b12b14.051]
MRNSVEITKINNKIFNFLVMLLREITAAEVTSRQKAEGRMQHEDKISRAGTIAPSSVFSVWIIALLVLNGLLVAGRGDRSYDGQIALGFLAIANIVMLAVSVRSRTSAIPAYNNRQSGKASECDRIFSLSLDMLCVVGFDGYIKRINPAAETILGYSPAEMVGKLFIEFVHPDDRETTLKQAESIAAGNNTVGFENRWRCQNGSYKWIAWTVSPFCEEELIYAVGRDVTDHKIAQESLQHSNSILRSVIESTPDVIFVKDIQGRYAIGNSALAQFLEKPIEAIIGKDDAALFPAEIAQEIIETDRKIIAAGEQLNYEEVVPRNGEMRTFMTAKCPWRDSEGNAIGIIAITRDISDRKAIEAALLESNILFESVIESTSDSIFVKDTQGSYLLVNSTTAGIIGLPKSEIIGKNDAQLLPAEIADMLVENDRRIWQSGIEETIEEVVKDSEGNILTFLCTKSPLRDRAGNITGIVGVTRDISDRKRAEAAAIQSQERLQLALWGSDSGMWDWNRVTDEMYFSHEYSALLGYEAGELQTTASALSQLVHPEDLWVLNQKLNAYLANPENGYVVEHRMLAKSGEYQWILARGKVVERDENNAPVRMIGTISDIGDRKRTEKALQESEERYRCLIEATSQIVWDTTATGEVITEQTGWSAFTGATYDEMKGWGWINNIHPDDREYTARMWSDALTNGTLFAIEHRLLRHDGEYRYMSVRAVPLLNADGSVRQWVGIHSDITESKITEQEIQQQKEFLGSIYDGVDYSIFVLDVGADGELRYSGWNRASELFSGLSSELGCGKTPEEILSESTAAFFRPKLRECLLKNTSISYEQAVDFGNTKFWCITTLNPLRDESGKICRIVGNAVDITDRKKAEAQLREQEEFLNSIYNGSNQVIFVVDVTSEGEFRYAGWNAATEASTGILSNDVKGKTPEEVFPGPEAANFRQRYVDCLAVGSSISYENSAELAGVEYWFIVTLTPLRDACGNIYRLIGNSTDITDRKIAEAALQESQHFVERIADTSPNILYVYDEIEQRNVYTNREITDTLGYTLAEIQQMGSSLLPTIIHPEDLAKIPGYLQELENAPDGEVVEYEYRVRDKQNCWHWLVSREIVFSRTESGKIRQRLGAATDVTERKFAEQVLAEQLKISSFTADVGMALTQNRTLPATLQCCTDAVVRHLDAAFARIWTLHEEGNFLDLQASAGMYTHIDGAHSRIAVGEFKIGLIAQERKPHLTNFVLEDSRVSDKEWAKREGMVAFAGYPLIVDNQLVGVIAMFARHELQESTLIALASIADSIALGIKRKQTEVALAAQKQTLRGIIDNAPIWVWMANASGRMLLVNKTFCQDVAIPEENFLAASHYSEVLGLEVSANCMASDAQAWSQDTPCYAEELLQLVDGEYHQLEVIKTQVKDDSGRAIGLIGLGLDVTKQKESQRQLQESEARFRKLAEQEALLNQLANNIRQSLDLDTILATTVQQIRELLQLDRCVFIWYMPNEKPAVWNVEYESKNADLHSLLGVFNADGTGTQSERIDNFEIIRINDFRTVADPVERDFFLGIGFQSMLEIPILISGGKTGILCCSSCSALRCWSDEEVELLVAVGNQLAIAINQAELYEISRLVAAEASSAAMKQKLLNQLGSQIRASLDLDTILATTVHQIRDLLQLDRCLFIWYVSEAEIPAWDVVHEAKNDDLFSLVGYYPAEVTGTLAQKIANLEIYQVDDVASLSDPIEREFFLQVGYKSVLDLPVKSAGGLVGLVGCMACAEVRRWTQDEVDLLSAICDQLSIAISQSELYTQSVDSARIAREQTAQLEATLCELQQAQTQLVQAEKMSSLGQMVAGIAHEINNPVSFIFGNLTYTEEYTTSLMTLLQMYREEYPEPPQAIKQEIDGLELDFLLDDLPKMLSSMQVGATRIRDIVRSLRNFSRLDESDMKNVNIHEGIDSTLMILEHRLKAQPVSVAGTEYHRPAIQVLKEYGELPLVECYAGQLNQVFMNIIANAIDALQEPLQNQGIIRIRTEVEGTFAVIRIADNGAGIADKVKQRIFDPFYTTKPIGSGTGMGLAISHSIIVEKHKGKINCSSAVGKGTEFAIEIPIKKRENLIGSIVRT